MTNSKRDDRGFTLIEVVVAMVIFGLLLSAVLVVILSTQRQEVSNRSRVAAASLAAREIDLVRGSFSAWTGTMADFASSLSTTGTDPDPLPGGTAGQALVVDGQPYTVTRTAAWNLTAGGGSACSGGSMVSYPTLGVTVTVTWPNMGEVKPVVSTTALAPTKSAGISSSNAFIITKVLDSTGAVRVGVPLTASGSGTSAAVTDASGCAVLVVAPPSAGGTYQVSVADGSLVDSANLANPSKSTGLLTQGATTNLTFSVDRPGTVVIALVDANGNPVPDAAAAGSTITLYSMSSPAATPTTTVTATAATTSFSGLWPRTYGAYLGTTAPGTFPSGVLAPGGTVTISLQVSLLRLTVTNLPVGSTTAWLVPSGATVNCSTGVSAAVSGSSATLNALPGTYTLAVAGPFGCAAGVTGSMYTGTLTWTSALTVTGAPASGTLWAVSSSQVPGTPTTCPASTNAVNVSAARTGSASLAPGTWYLYLTDGAATGTCLAYPTSNPVTVSYGSTTTIAWTNPATLTMTGLNWWGGYYLLVTRGTTCTATPSSVSSSAASLGSTSRSVTVDRGLSTDGTVTWNAFQWDKGSNCTPAGSFSVSSTTSSLTKGTTGSTGP